MYSCVSAREAEREGSSRQSLRYTASNYRGASTRKAAPRLIVPVSLRFFCFFFEREVGEGGIEGSGSSSGDVPTDEMALESGFCLWEWMFFSGRMSYFLEMG